jgi:hypothetical protein
MPELESPQWLVVRRSGLDPETEQGSVKYVELSQFDVSAKELVWDGPAAWLDRFRIAPVGPERTRLAGTTSNRVIRRDLLLGVIFFLS